MIRLAVIIIASICLAACTAMPVNYTARDAPLGDRYFALSTGRPIVALALGSGGPRGFAHVGVLKVLDEAGLKPDLIIGTSAGAVMGSLYAAGLSGKEIEAQIMALEHSDVVDLVWSSWGYIRGEALQQWVNKQVSGRRLEELPIPFAAAAVKVPTGELTLFNRGNTGIAVRASSSIPGTFLPVIIHGQGYYDGDLVSPVPILAAKKLGAQIIIAVDVSADLNDTPPIDQAPISWITNGILRKTLIDNEAVEATLLLRPRLPYLAGLSDDYKSMAIRKGEESAREALPRIRALFNRQ